MKVSDGQPQVAMQHQLSPFLAIIVIKNLLIRMMLLQKHCRRNLHGQSDKYLGCGQTVLILGRQYTELSWLSTSTAYRRDWNLVVASGRKRIFIFDRFSYYSQSDLKSSRYTLVRRTGSFLTVVRRTGTSACPEDGTLGQRSAFLA